MELDGETKQQRELNCGVELNVLHPAGNGDRQHAEWQEGIPEGRRGRQGQVGVPQLRRRVVAERDGAAGGGKHRKRQGGRVLHSCESEGRVQQKRQSRQIFFVV